MSYDQSVDDGMGTVSVTMETYKVAIGESALVTLWSGEKQFRYENTERTESYNWRVLPSREKNLLMTSEGGPPEKKSKRSGESNTCNDPRLQQNDFICPICFEVWDEVYVTVCGHSFCFRCITKVIGQKPECPVCKTALSVQNPIHPNFSLHDIVTKYHQQSVSSTLKTPHLQDI
eukprot:Em0118g8a